jgi:release factor glutamine methyltransferase
MSTVATIGSELDRAAGRLKSAGIPAPRSEARLLMGYALGLGREAVFGHADRPVTRRDAKRFEGVVGRRATREPAARILGCAEFWSLPFQVTAATLIPRPETETVIEAALDVAGGGARAIDILDLGTGTGCLLLALLSELADARGLGVDASAAALEVAAANASALGLSDRARFRLGDWGRGLRQRFDLIVANPPYIRADEIGGLEPEVARFEPVLALSGGADGLECYRALAADIRSVMAPGARIAVEIGEGQGDGVAAILGAQGLDVTDRRADLSGIPRCLVAEFTG